MGDEFWYQRDPGFKPSFAPLGKLHKPDGACGVLWETGMTPCTAALKLPRDRLQSTKHRAT